MSEREQIEVLEVKVESLVRTLNIKTLNLVSILRDMGVPPERYEVLLDADSAMVGQANHAGKKL